MRRFLACLVPLLLAGCGGSSSSSQQHPPAPPTDDATITIAVGTIIRDIPATLYGSNIEWIDGGNGIWDTTTNAIKPWQITRAHDAGVTLLRFPGGALADGYHWQDGIGPRAARPQRPDTFDGTVHANDFGTDELFSFCASVGAEPLMQANVVTGTAAEAAGWVHYCNDASRRVRLWEVGNEQYLEGGGNLTSTEYATRFNAFADAMKAADPGIKVGAVTATQPYVGAYPVPDPTAWNGDALIAAVAAKADFIALHDAYAPVLVGAPATDFWGVYRAVLAFPRQVERHLALVDGKLTSIAHDGGRIRLAITEWGPLFTVDPHSGWLDHPKTLGSALLAAGTLHAFLRSARVDIANQFRLADPATFIGMCAYDGTPKAIWYAFQMYRQHFGPRLVRATATSPTFDSPAVGWIAAESGTPCLDVVASTSADGATLYVMAINRSLDHALTTRIAVNGFAPRATARRFQLTASAIDANDGRDLLPVLDPLVAPPVVAPTGSQFLAGAPGAVATHELAPLAVGASFTCTFPPMSLTALEIPAATVAAPTAVARAR